MLRPPALFFYDALFHSSVVLGKHFLRVHSFAVSGRSEPHIGAVTLELPALHIVGKLQVKCGLDAASDGGIEHRYEHFNAAVEIARHQVG